MTGKGKFTYMHDNKIYEGKFVNGIPEGEGIMISPSYYYRGSFLEG